MKKQLAERIFGYRSDDHLAFEWIVGLRILFAVAVIVAAATAMAFAYRERVPTRGNIRIVSTLDEFTRDATAETANTIPAFLELPGDVGVLGPSSNPDEAVQPLDITELREGFCSPSIARQLRHQYPGYYDSWPDEKLQRLAFEKYPELRERRCALSYTVDATPVSIIKFQLRPRTIVEHGGLVLLTGLVTATFAVGCLNLYYRVLVDHLTPASPQPSWNPEV